MIKKRALTALATAGLIAATLLVTTPANASDIRSIKKYIQVEVLNTTDFALTTTLAAKPSLENGATTHHSGNGLPNNLDQPINLSPGFTTSYQIDLEGKKEITSNGRFNHLNFDNYFVISVGLNGINIPQRIAATHYADIVERSLPINEEKARIAGVATEWQQMSNSEGLQVKVEDIGNPQFEALRRYRLTVSEASPPAAFVVPSVEDLIQPTATRLTGATTADPVYKVTVPGYQKSFTELPSEIPVDPYTVRGQGPDGSWSDLGQVVPVAAPVIDYDTKTITYSPASFFHQSTASAPTTALSITGYPYHLMEGQWVRPSADWCAPWSEIPPCFVPYKLPDTVNTDPAQETRIDLVNAVAPPADLVQSAGVKIEVAATTGGVVANGAAQEPLKLKLKLNSTVINPDDNPDLSRLYDYVYYTDSAGSVITGLYKPGGYTTIGTIRGSYVNELTGFTADTASPNRVYLSSTSTDPTKIIANLRVGATAVSADPGKGTEITKVAPTTTIGASGTTLFTSAGAPDRIGDPASNNEAGVFHQYNGTKPAAALITRYQTATATAALPVKQTYTGQYTVQNNGLIATPNNETNRKQSLFIQTHIVNTQGSYVPFPLLNTQEDSGN